jgi:hypothetical protein
MASPRPKRQKSTTPATRVGEEEAGGWSGGGGAPTGAVKKVAVSAVKRGVIAERGTLRIEARAGGMAASAPSNARAATEAMAALLEPSGRMGWSCAGEGKETGG